MDLADSQGNSILNGWPLVTGSNLFGQLNYLALLPPGFAIFVASDGQEPDAVPTYTESRPTVLISISIIRRARHERKRVIVYSEHVKFAEHAAISTCSTTNHRFAWRPSTTGLAHGNR